MTSDERLLAALDLATFGSAGDSQGWLGQLRFSSKKNRLNLNKTEQSFY